jgi:hypothetical protein
MRHVSALDDGDCVMIYIHNLRVWLRRRSVALFKRRAAEAVAVKPTDHAVIVHYALTGGDHGTEAQREAIFCA